MQCSWRERVAAQNVTYSDADKLTSVTEQLKALPGLVSHVEIDRLRDQLAKAADGKAFLLQCGDCAELFSYCNGPQIDAKLKLTLIMSLVIIYGARMPVIRVGRIAGQYAKPRSKPTEMIDTPQGKKEVLSFRCVVADQWRQCKWHWNRRARA